MAVSAGSDWMVQRVLREVMMIRRGPARKAWGDKRVRRQEEGAPKQKQTSVLVGEQKEPNVAGAQRVWARQEVSSEREMGVWGRRS